jgi:AAA domain
MTWKPGQSGNPRGRLTEKLFADAVRLAVNADDGTGQRKLRRIAEIVASAQQEAALDAMRVIAGDLIEEGGIGNLADPAVQAELDKYLDGVDLLILDNLSSLTAVIRDNDQESWTTIQQWLLRLRRRGISVLLVHHAGKAGEQRGTSRRDRWRRCVEDGRRFLARWGDNDETGLIWLLQGREVVVLTEATAAISAAIQNPTRAVTVYRRFNKPALGPLGDSLDDLEPPFGGSAA